MEKMTLNSETEFAEVKGRWMTTYNLVCVIIFFIVFITTLAKGNTGVGGALFFAFLICVGAFLIKQKVAKLKRLGLGPCAFMLCSEATMEEIVQKVAYPLLEKGIQTDIVDGKLTFQGKTAVYTFSLGQDETCFFLDWHYPIGKIFSPKRWQMISDYKEVLSELGMIAYYIQQA